MPEKDRCRVFVGRRALGCAFAAVVWITLASFPMPHGAFGAEPSLAAGDAPGAFPGRIYLASRPGKDPLSGIVALDPNDKTWRKVTDAWSIHPRVSPDGRRLAVSAGGFDEPGAAVWVYDTSGQNKRLKVLDAGSALPAAWSPDGRSILAWYRKFGQMRVEPWLVAADGSGKRRLPIPGTEYVCDWRGEGDRILSFSIRKERAMPYYLTHPDGTGERLLLASSAPVPGYNGRLGFSPRFSADGRKVLVERFGFDGRESTISIMILDVDGRPPREIRKRKTAHRMTAINPCDSPDGRAIAIILQEEPPRAAPPPPAEGPAATKTNGPPPPPPAPVPGPDEPLPPPPRTHIEIVDWDGRLLRTIPLPDGGEFRSIVDWR